MLLVYQKERYCGGHHGQNNIQPLHKSFLALTYSHENGGIKPNKTNITPTKFSPSINMTITNFFNMLLIEVLPLLFKVNIYTITEHYLEKLNGN